jgi:NADP-dependent 3-hydroxy acid dehydrogenase YdfG
MVGRDRSALAKSAAEARQSSEAFDFAFDLTQETASLALIDHVKKAGRLDILVHAAGTIHQAPMQDSQLRDLDAQYAVNVRAPYALTQLLLPMLIASRGQIVFLNSSVGLAVRRPEVGQYSATKHALRAIADSLREELNPKGVRVLSVYLGRTATPLQEELHRQESKQYRPEKLIQAEDVASTVIHALGLPRSVEVTDISMRPMEKG